jgi:sulfur carrier protein ThiS
MINVRVARVPGTVQEVALNDGASVGDALGQLGMRVESGEALKVNGADATTSSTLSDGDRVILVKGAKGN